MNKRLYILAGTVVLLGTISMGTIAYLQGDFKANGIQSNSSASQISYITLSENGAQTTSNKVEVGDAVITITVGGQYEITGQATTTTVHVSDQVTDDVTIRLNNADFASLDFQSTGTNKVEIVPQSNNRLSGEDVGISATNVTILGDGVLAIEGVSKYGIMATDDLVIESGEVSVDSAGSGLVALNETEAELGNVVINGGNLTIAASQQEGAAVLASNRLMMNNGLVQITDAYEAYVAKNMTISGGETRATTVANGFAARDSLDQEGKKTGAELHINGGTNTLTAGLSPLLANGTMELTGGLNTFLTTQLGQPILNYTTKAELTGGTLIALGAAEFSATKQGLLTTNLVGNAGDTVTITDAAGNEVASYQSPVAFSTVTYSSTNLSNAELYYLSTTSGNYGQATATNGNEMSRE